MEMTAVDKKKYEQYIQGTIQKYKAAKQDLEIKFRYVKVLQLGARRV